MVGTIRTFDDAVRKDIIDRMDRTVKNTAAASGATAMLTIADAHNPPVINDRALTERSLPALERVAGKDRVRTISLQTTGEDFSFYGQDIPSLFFWVGVTPPDRDAATAPFNHSPLFFMDEASLTTGMRALLAVATDYLQASER
jgi:metal-dependent amidase/aminoacylase/carboxypeptidase family protein